jgi:hypothetical protein
MAIYRNTAQAAKFFPDYGMIPAGEYVQSDKYPWPLDAAFELVQYGDAPWMKLHAAVPPATIAGLSKYGQILVVNNTGAVVSVKANEDATNVLAILDGHIYPIHQDHEIDKLEITGSGAGTLYVYGLV